MMKVSDLTNGERLEVDRRRLGLTQCEMAANYDVSTSQYRKWENGEVPCPHAPAVSVLIPAEACRLQRRREGMTEEDLAARIGVTRFWVLRMERGMTKPTRLVDFWEKTLARRERRRDLRAQRNASN